MQSVIMRLLFPDKEIKYSHVGLIHGADGKKMSKREGDDSFLGSLTPFIVNGGAITTAYRSAAGSTRHSQTTTTTETQPCACARCVWLLPHTPMVKNGNAQTAET
jgi:glutamyl/glutaminyl-tRNA synthetase